MNKDEVTIEVGKLEITVDQIGIVLNDSGNSIRIRWDRLRSLGKAVEAARDLHASLWRVNKPEGAEYQ